MALANGTSRYAESFAAMAPEERAHLFGLNAGEVEHLSQRWPTMNEQEREAEVVRLWRLLDSVHSRLQASEEHVSRLRRQRASLQARLMLAGEQQQVIAHHLGVTPMAVNGQVYPPKRTKKVAS